MKHTRLAGLFGAGSLPFLVVLLDATGLAVAGETEPSVARVFLAQAEVQIPSDTQLERMEGRGITASPLNASGAAGASRGEEAEIRQMDEHARRIDKQLMGDSAICADCK